MCFTVFTAVGMEFFSNFRISPLLYDLSLMDLQLQPVTFLPVSRPSDGASGSARFYGRGSTSPSPCLPRERDPAGVRGGKARARLLPTHAGARGQPHGHALDDATRATSGPDEQSLCHLPKHQTRHRAVPSPANSHGDGQGPRPPPGSSRARC